MNRDFPQNERQFLAVVEKTKARNFHILDLYSNFLNFESDFIKKELIDELKNDCGVDSLTAYTAVLSSAFDIDSEFSEEDRIFENEYLKKSVEILKKEDYYSNLYIKKIKFPSVKRGSWEMRTSTYKPYEAFVCRGITLEGGMKELPHIGFFEEEFSYPAVYENGREWMTVTPNEVETMKDAVAEASGRVLTLGLGLGYFTFQASEKENVTSVTVVERDKNVISLFCEFILPQFPHAEKINIVEGDALAYLEKNSPEGKFDFMFADIWHDSSDGLDLYIKLKNIEKRQIGGMKSRLLRRYWIERTILSRLRWMIFAELTDEKSAFAHLSKNYKELTSLLSDESLASIAGDIRALKL